jgi:hypothetical protein
VHATGALDATPGCSSSPDVTVGFYSPCVYVQDNHLSDIQEGHEDVAAGLTAPRVSPDASSSAFYDSSDVYHSGDHYTDISDFSMSDKPYHGGKDHRHRLRTSALHAWYCMKLSEFMV